MVTAPIGDRVRSWREAQDPQITQQQLSADIHITQPTLSSFECEPNRRFEPETAVRLEIRSNRFFSAEELVHEKKRWLLPALRERMLASGELDAPECTKGAA